MFMDLDHFKDVNDRLGHAAGDELLLQFTSRVQSCLREDDTLRRLGGDEFIVLLPDLEQVEDAYRVAERLIAGNQEPYRIDGEDLTVGSSIGISLYPQDGTTASELLQGAVIAMYRAKQDWLNLFRLFSLSVAEGA